MADAGQEPTVSTEGPTPTDPTTDTNPSTDASSQAEPRTYDETYVKTLRSEAAASRAKLRDFEKADADRKAAEMSDLERTQARAQAAEERVTLMEKRAAKRDAIVALEKASVIDPDLAYSALESQIEIKEGEATNIADLVATFVKARPQMVKKADSAPVLPSTNALNPPATPSVPVRSRPVGRL